MSASTQDKITDVRNAARPNSARVTSGRSAGGATLACDNLSGWPTASKVHLVTYKIDSNSAVVAGSQLDCYAIVSGNNLGSFTVVDGTDTGHAVGDVVEMLPTAAWGQDLADALTVGHTRTGAHVANLPLTTPILTTPTIADFTSATHTPQNAAGGGTLAYAALLSTIFSSQLLTQANAGSAGGTMSYINLGGIKLLWCLSTSHSSGASALGYDFTLPSAFFSTISFASATSYVQASLAEQYANISASSTTTITAKLVSPGGAATSQIALLVIGT